MNYGSVYELPVHLKTGDAYLPLITEPALLMRHALQMHAINRAALQPSPLLLYQQSWRADEQQWIKIAEVHSTEVMEIDEGYLV